MENMLLVVQVILATGLIGLVLLQRSDTDGFGLGSGGSNFMSGRAKANLLTRATAFFAALFIINSLALSILASHHHESSILETIDAEEAKDAKTTAPVVDKKDTKKEVKDTKDEKPAAKDKAPAVPNADETKPAEKDEKAEKPVASKPVKKAKHAVDADADADKTSDHNEE